ncbi:MAG: hypothetical protein DRO39_01995 [Thermoprotei archaeon]|nr:MAG: hypothetical protein DRO39_01995 [Thermoprotei archaeon]
MPVEVSIFSSGAYSIKKVARQLYRVLREHVKCKLYHGFFNPNVPRGYAIIVGNPHFWEKRIYDALKTNHNIRGFIFYMTVEGNVRESHLRHIQWLHDGVIVTPSHYVKRKLEQCGFRVEKVIPHGVEVYGDVKRRNTGTLGYIAGYLQRKYPRYGVEAVRMAGVRPYLITTGNNPYLKYFSVVSTKEYHDAHVPDWKVLKLYRDSAFYLNLSDAEGFGITPLEACAMGTPVIAPRYPPLTEFLLPFTLWVPVTGRVWYENWGGWLDIEHHEYRPADMARVIRRALGMSDREYEELSAKCIEHALRYDIRRVYTQFLDLVT